MLCPARYPDSMKQNHKAAVATKLAYLAGLLTGGGAMYRPMLIFPPDLAPHETIERIARWQGQDQGLTAFGIVLLLFGAVISTGLAVWVGRAKPS